MAALRVVIAIAFLALIVISWLVFSAVIVTTDSARDVAGGVLRDEFARADVRADAFTFSGISKSGWDFIATWQSIDVPAAQVGVSITPFDVDVWGSPIIPNCKDDRARTVATFGDVCITGH